MTVADIRPQLEEAVALHRRGAIAEAVARYQNILREEPTNSTVLYLLGTAALQANHYADALRWLKEAAGAKPQWAAAHHLTGIAQVQLGRFEDALASFERAVAIEPGSAEFLMSRANALNELGRFEQSVAAYRHLLGLRPDLADAWHNLSYALLALHRAEEAAASIDRALALQPNAPHYAMIKANSLRALGRHDEALAAYDGLLALQQPPFEALLGRALVLLATERADEALACADRALAAAPFSPEGQVVRGHALRALHRYDDALAAYDCALKYKPDGAEAWAGRGSIFIARARFAEALPCYEKVVALTPDLPHAKGQRLHSRLHICDWNNLDAEIADLLAAVRKDLPAAMPFDLLPILSSAGDQLQCARNYLTAQGHFPSLCPAQAYAHDRIRVAYLSGDLCEHPIGYLVADLFDNHDKSRFAITGISFDSNPDSETHRRIKGALEDFIEAGSLSNRDIAQLVRRREIDIAVDLHGFTLGNRLSVFARRPAPIQVSYLGYLGTLGADFIDYVIADEVALPFDQQPFYSEKIIHLPECFLATGALQGAALEVPTREEAGLPPGGFVFCSFNASYKLGRPMFELWMRLLRAVEGSVLWLLESNAEMTVNLRAEVQRCGVEDHRVIFAPRVPLPQHLARQALADLFLDTTPYNAGATAAATLWTGVPVLTMLGSTFVGRMAASMLHAVGLPELVTESLEEYERLAIRLAREPDLLAAFKRKLANGRDSYSLFDTRRLTRHIEAAYAAMWETHRRNQPPSGFAVNPLGRA